MKRGKNETILDSEGGGIKKHTTTGHLTDDCSQKEIRFKYFITP